MIFLNGKSLPLQFILLLIWLCFVSSATNAAGEGEEAPPSEEAEAPPPPKGKSILLFGGFFHKIRQRWSGQQQPNAPIYAGPAFPLLGYQNCPIYGGCNQPWAYHPIPYGVPTVYYPDSPYISASPQQQQQQQQQIQENKVIILHTGQGQISSHPHALPYPSFAPGQQYPPYTFNDYGPVVYSNSPVPVYGPNYLPVPGGVAHNRPGTAVSVATSGGSNGCNTPLNACNFA